MLSSAEMLELIPYELRKSPQYKAIFEAEGKQFDRIEFNISDILDQTFIDTATWGLEIQEKELGIKTELGKPIEERRSVVKSKKRGMGTVTVDLVKSVTEAYYGGEVEVYEIPGAYLINIKFVSSLGVPSNLTDVENSLREIIPAHLGIEFKFSYFLIREIHNIKTLAEMETFTLDKFAGGA
ncbi:YmfQ family protein [Siminovitchia terrae]|uniref:YmfQ family protein n=1 Tax=Siminovitchia terrae TaxID=1914933 RepID=UPI0028AC2717|nr:YmfQ family protein [Siminovitchia terrae]